MKPNILLIFTDLTDYTYQLDIARTKLLDICERKQINYFCTMLNNYKESTMDKITIQVPYASAMESIMQDILDKSKLDSSVRSNAVEIVKRIYCMDFLGMDTLNEFNKLFNAQIDSDTYELIHDFVDQKEYNNDIYIRFIATRIPVNYDLTEFTKELLERMQQLGKMKFVVLYNTRRIVVWSMSDNSFRQLANEYNDEVEDVILNPISPMVAVLFGWHLVVYDVFSGKVIDVIERYNTGGHIMHVCFSLCGKKLYVCYSLIIYVYDTHTFQIKKTYSLNYPATRMISSPNNLYLALEKKSYVDNRKTLHILNLQTGSIKNIGGDTVGSNFQFVGNSILMYRSVNHNYYKYSGYNCDTNQHVKKDRNFASNPKHIFDKHKDKVLCHNRDIFICYRPFRNINHYEDTFILRNTKVLTKVSVAREDADKLYTCFSHSGKYIYTVTTTITGSSVKKHMLLDNGTVELIWTNDIDPARITYANGIACGSYVNPKIIDQLNQMNLIS